MRKFSVTLNYKFFILCMFSLKVLQPLILRNNQELFKVIK